MFCAKCGQTLPDDAMFCHKCGWKVPQAENEPEPQVNAAPAPKQKRQSLKCPKCGSEDVQFATSTSTSGISAGDACCGYMLLGPLGLLCGLAGAGKSTTSEFWVCHSCGAKFKADEARETQEKRLRDKATYEALLQDAPEDLEGRQREVEQGLADISKLYNEQNEQLKADYPKYKYTFIGMNVGGVAILIGLVLALLSFPSGRVFGIITALLGVILYFVSSNQEDTIFDSIASPELKRIKEKKKSLEEQKKKAAKQIEAKAKKEKIDRELDRDDP